MPSTISLGLHVCILFTAGLATAGLATLARSVPTIRASQVLADSTGAYMCGEACTVLESSLEWPCFTALLVEERVLQQLMEHHHGAAQVIGCLHEHLRGASRVRVDCSSWWDVSRPAASC